LLFGTQSALLVLALVLAWRVAAGTITPWEMLTIALANGIVVAIDLPARLAFVVEMVGRDDLMNAVALNSLLFNSARIIGPAIAGVLLWWLGPAPCFTANAASYLAVLWALYRMDVGLRAAPRGARGSLSLRAGLTFLAERPGLAVLVLLAGVLAVCGWPVLALLPGLAQRSLGTQAQGYTIMVSAVGVGALAAALPVATFGSMARQRRFIGTGLCAVSAGLLGLSFSTNLALAAASCTLLGFGLILYLATSQAVVQLSAADHNRGLLMGIWAMVQSGGVPLGNLITGPAADYLGESRILFFQGLLCACSCVGLLFFFRTPGPPPEAL
jgi:MFS family permease